jgi:Zn-dependent protease with chaperone function
MGVLLYAPLLLAGLFGAVAPIVARRLWPAWGTWLLSVGGLIAAGGSVAVLGFLAFSWVGRAPLLAAQGHWSTTTLRHADPVPAAVELAALLGLAVVSVRVVAVALRRGRAVVQAYRLAARLPAHGGELAVLDDPAPVAYAVPGRPGRIVASTGLVRALDAGERRAVLAHERSHLRHRHHLHHAAGQLAAATNPLLRRIPAALLLATERWADEDAARTVRRDTVARALTRSARTRPPHTHAGVVLAVAAEQIAARVHALQEPPPRPTAWRIAALITLLAVCAGSTLAAAHETERLFEVAKNAYLLAHR